MLHQTQGIVLHHIKYKETSIIVTIYTQRFGRQSYLVNNVRSRKSKGATVFLQPMTQLDMQVYHRPKSDLQRIKDFKVMHPLINIPFKQEKRAIAFFLTELMSRVLREEEENTDLFTFISQSIDVFDAGVDGDYNFHLFFLFQLTRFLGFGPDATSNELPYFDLLNGHFEQKEPSHGFFITEKALSIWKQLFSLEIHNLSALGLSRADRLMLLEHLLEYYRLHIDNMGELKSLPIVHQLFHME